MKDMRNDMLDLILDACNEVELEVQATADYKELMMQLELKRNLVKKESDPDVKATLLDEIEEIYTEFYNMQLIANIKMIVCKRYMFEYEL